MSECRVGVVVLGDLARSPRMKYHALSLLSHGFSVDLVGYQTSPLPASLTSRARVRSLPPVPGWVNSSLPRILSYLVKTVWQAVTLLLTLPLLSRLDYLLVQTPPGVPTLPTLALYCWVKGTRLVVDWHNYSHTILALALHPAHPLVSLTNTLERLAAATAHSAFCVTKAMKLDLETNWGISANVLYDRPPARFRPISSEEREELFSKLARDHPVFSQVTDNTGLIVSSTSWTEDEDFGVLLSALVLYEAAKDARAELPELLVVITGKGPQKQYYLEKISTLSFNHVKIVTPWLELEDYPTMVAAAHLGICLHTSSSGLDLPMKVVDMFGCRLPVAAFNFQALPELVIDGVNGHVFTTSEELSEIIARWFTNFPQLRDEEFKKNIDKFRAVGWDQNWDEVALKIFQQKTVRPSISGSVLIAFFICLFCMFSSLIPTVQ